MANIKASKKDIIKSRKNRARNQNHKTSMKTAVKKAVVAIKADTAEKVTTTQAALRLIDKTAAKGVIHKRTAARKKSRLTRALQKTVA